MLVILLALLLSATPAFADPGDLDPSFGDGGVARMSISGEGIGRSSGAVVQADGKVVTVGTSDGDDFAIARFREDGTLDPTFSDDGRLTLSFGGQDGALAVVQQPDGKLLVAGGSGCRPVVVRLTADGMVDPSFAFDGSWGVCTAARLIAAQDDGKVVIAGYDVIYGTWMVRRMLANGAPDPAFADGGAFTRSAGSYAAVNALAVDTAGRVLLAGDIGGWSGGTEVGRDARHRRRAARSDVR